MIWVAAPEDFFEETNLMFLVSQILLSRLTVFYI